MDKDNLLTARIEDGIVLSAKTQYPHFIGFLNEHEQALALQYLSGRKGVRYSTFGGYPDSERKLLAITDNYGVAEEYTYPISAIYFQYDSRYQLTHRDFLGSIMALGIKREAVGDILVADGIAIAFVKEEIRDYIIHQIQKIGKTGVTLSEWDSSMPLPQTKHFEEHTYTVASARLDSIVSAIVPLSREKSAVLIRQGMVFVNGLEIKNISHNIKSKDIITVRGKGKFIVETFSGTTRKGRLKMNIRKYR